MWTDLLVVDIICGSGLYAILFPPLQNILEDCVQKENYIEF